MQRNIKRVLQQAWYNYVLHGKFPFLCDIIQTLAEYIIYVSNKNPFSVPIIRDRGLFIRQLKQRPLFALENHKEIQSCIDSICNFFKRNLI